MRRIKPRQSFEAYLYGQKQIEVVEEKYDNTNTISSTSIETPDQFKQLVELTRLYRHYQKAYLAKVKRNEFAKDELHFTMKYQEKIDNLLKHITL